MKKHVLGFFAVVLAVAFSAFTTKDQSADEMYFWYNQTSGEFEGSSVSVDDNPLGCSAEGDNCIKGYLRPTQPPSEPTGSADAEFSFNP